MRYEHPEPLDRATAHALLRSNKPEEVCRALLAVVLHDNDWRWAQEQCIEATRHASREVRALAMTCFGHIARIHGRLDLEEVLPVLRELQNDGVLAGRVEDAIDDIEMFCGTRGETTED